MIIRNRSALMRSEMYRRNWERKAKKSYKNLKQVKRALEANNLQLALSIINDALAVTRKEEDE